MQFPNYFDSWLAGISRIHGTVQISAEELKGFDELFL
jgi:hypothetical protein